MASDEVATLVAAGVAAGASILTLGISLFTNRRAEARAAHRLALADQLPVLAEGLHEVSATAEIIRKRFVAGQDPRPWIARFETGKAKLDVIRPRIRYTLWGLDEGIRTLSRLGHWVATYRDQDGAERLLAEAKKRKKAHAAPAPTARTDT